MAYYLASNAEVPNNVDSPSLNDEDIKALVKYFKLLISIEQTNQKD